jgi:hypothetical protein
MPPAKTKLPAGLRLNLGFFNYATGKPWTAAEIAAEHRRRDQEAERQEQIRREREQRKREREQRKRDGPLGRKPRWRPWEFPD